MYIVIAGGGLIGKGLAKILVNNKHDVVIIDRDSKTCEDIYARIGAVTINGDATELETLEAARMDKADVAVAVTPQDSSNLAFSLLAKHFKVKQILVRMNDLKYEDVYRTSGVEHISRTTDLLINQLLTNIESPEIKILFTLNSFDQCLITVAPGSHCAGMSVAEIFSHPQFKEKLSLSCILEADTDRPFIPTGATVLKANDRLFVCGKREDVKKAASFLRKK